MIEGVVVKEVASHADQRGFFREIFRVEKEAVEIGQLSHSLVLAGVVKAWHVHAVQSQWNYVACGLIKVVLHDTRVDSPTYRKTMEFLAGDGQSPQAYFFPPGVAHGYKCLQGPMHIIYATSGVYDLSDEIRISQGDKEIGYNWSV
ncbi:MAG: hypothetical protein A2787_02050 [Omnitrophica WOR_2 bacterium RIFCSPHIGHO2_01_FULL_48_9]|nr:MAG: hypothetical protein A3D10_01770 [Omnitrophica WOR_2 bacterium RIFCSPHIGHO2_02_FULL_48_11]OGX34417.1 MAG: hypothetical protein A2787_02050 [Omnitrophica WOR_2 bacterium RIFCSPHIGHO2_01_FULL_48_9]